VIKEYYYLTKPGIIRGNILTLITGFLVGSALYGFDSAKLIFAILGTSLVVASACILNNILDIDIDAKMQRTKKRALVTHKIPVKDAIIYASVFGLAGTAILYFLVNSLTAILGLLGMYLYVVVYTYLKRKTVFSTLIGSLSGSIPPVAGYASATNQIDIYSGILFVSMAFWQMSHFYAISLYRFNDYKKAKIPLLPIEKSLSRAKFSIILYIVGFIFSLSLMFVYAMISELSVVLLVSLSTLWLASGLYYIKMTADKWGKMMFLISLIVISFWCLVLSVDSLI